MGSITPEYPVSSVKRLFQPNNGGCFTSTATTITARYWPINWRYTDGGYKGGFDCVIERHKKNSTALYCTLQATKTLLPIILSHYIPCPGLYSHKAHFMIKFV